MTTQVAQIAPMRLNKAAEYFDLRLEDIRGRAYKGNLIYARMILAGLLRNEFGLKSPAVGQLLNCSPGSARRYLERFDNLDWTYHVRQDYLSVKELINPETY